MIIFIVIIIFIITFIAIKNHYSVFNFFIILINIILNYIATFYKILPDIIRCNTVSYKIKISQLYCTRLCCLFFYCMYVQPDSLPITVNHFSVLSFHIIKFNTVVRAKYLHALYVVMYNNILSYYNHSKITLNHIIIML